ncbi:MAG TPA: hypothetical protein VEC97_00225 [Candidatus Acidoferrales bacterium]|nr:hypothetical protein [Candidatus Acidoferrales bacterium]
MRKIELASWKSVPQKKDSLRRSLKIMYGVKLETDSSIFNSTNYIHRGFP